MSDSIVSEKAPTVLLTLHEVALQLRKSDAQLRWMLHIDTAPTSALIGGRRMFRQSDVDEYIDAAFKGVS